MNNRTKNIALLAIPVLLVAGAWLYAGPLNPPPGPITSTYKTLTEVEPRIAINATNTPGDANSVFRIANPGSYYLAGNVAGVIARHGIEVAADNVTIDLNGFAVIGVAGSLDGVSDTGIARNNIRVEHGHITAWGSSGISFAGREIHIRDVSARACGSNGIVVQLSAIVESCVVGSNAGVGIQCFGSPAVVKGCVVATNTGNGISMGGSGTVSGCSANGNLTGISAGLGSVVVDCSARDNNADGISVSSSSVVNNCSAYSNGDDGVVSTSTSTTITNCTASFNSGDGIEVPGNCSIVGNTCDANGIGAGIGMGIRATGTDSRIDGNTLMRNDFGMSVELAGNFIVRNIAAGNTTNYQIIANNKVGTIVSAPNSLAIAGSTGGAGVGSTDPWANFSY